MPQYTALLYTADVDWSRPEYADQIAEYGEFGEANAKYLRGGAALAQTSTATQVKVVGARGGEMIVSDGPYAETKEALTGFYLFECADLDEALKLAAQIPAAWHGTVEVRPVLEFGKE